MPAIRLLLAACLIPIATAPFAQPLEDWHLKSAPRTASERARIAAVTALPTDFSTPQRYESLPGGATTVAVHTGNQAFKQPAANLGFDTGLTFRLGEAMFDKLWVSAPSSTLASDGLGPLYNARACQSCHVRGGRGHAPDGPDDESAMSLALKLSVPGQIGDRISEIDGFLATRPDPTYGTQLQDFSLPGHPAEGRVHVAYEKIEVALSGGETAQLRKPTFSVKDLGYGPMHRDVMIGARVAPQMIGLGLLEAIPAEDILAAQDADDLNGDGVSGRANIVWSAEYQRPMLGRFGLKAGVPTLRQQSAAAFAADIGLSTPIFQAGHGDCSAAQAACVAAIHGDQDVRVYEVDDLGLDLVTFYSSNLAVPARRDITAPAVLRGKKIFYETGCNACHRPSFVTHRMKESPVLSFQLIWPFTDMLLHDMGPDLADNRPEARATGREWRTPPLWGVGLTNQVSGHGQYLHDGRARSLLEAVLWHGGEARSMTDTVVAMPPKDRADLIRFLESL